MTDFGTLASAVTGDVPHKFWNDLLYERSVNLIAGPSGMGKSFLSFRVAADISACGGTVLFCNDEDDAVVQRYRLDVAGANLDKVILARFVAPYDLGRLEQAIRTTAAKLVIFDTAEKHIQGPMQRWADPLREVNALMQSTGCAALYLHHTNKNVKKSADWRAAIGGATSGLTGTARMIGLVGKRPGNDDHLLWCPVKDNYGPTGDAVAFEWITEEIDQADGETIEVGRLSIAEKDVKVINPTALVVIQGDGEGKPGTDPVKAAEAADFLTNHLAAGAMPVSDVYRCKVNPDSTIPDVNDPDWKSRECGFLSAKSVNANNGACPDCQGDTSEIEGLKTLAQNESVAWGTIKRAKTALTIDSGKKGFSGGPSGSVGWWYLPDSHPALTPTALDYLP